MSVPHGQDPRGPRALTVMPWQQQQPRLTHNSTGKLAHTTSTGWRAHPSPPRDLGFTSPTPSQGPEHVALSGHFPGISAFVFPRVIGSGVGGAVGGEVIPIQQ